MEFRRVLFRSSILWTLSASDFQTPRATQSGVGAMSVDHVRIGVSGPCQTASITSIGYVPSPRPEASKSIDARGQRMEAGLRSVMAIGRGSGRDRRSQVVYVLGGAVYLKYTREEKSEQARNENHKR